MNGLNDEAAQKRRRIFFSKLQNPYRDNQYRHSHAENYSTKLPDEPLVQALQDKELRFTRLTETLKKNNTEVINYPLAIDQEKERIKLWSEIFTKHNLKKTAFSSKVWFAPALEQALENVNQEDKIFKKTKVFYTDKHKNFMNTEQEKLAFLNHDVGITSVTAGIASTGSLILVPSAEEPRSLSLVPRVHIAVLKEDDIIADFNSWITDHQEEVSNSHIVLISGPSKTADIEKRLVYGVHGPCTLIVLIAR